jgi:hypothetical protein
MYNVRGEINTINDLFYSQYVKLNTNHIINLHTVCVSPAWDYGRLMLLHGSLLQCSFNLFI